MRVTASSGSDSSIYISMENHETNSDVLVPILPEREADDTGLTFWNKLPEKWQKELSEEFQPVGRDEIERTYLKTQKYRVARALYEAGVIKEDHTSDYCWKDIRDACKDDIAKQMLYDSYRNMIANASATAVRCLIVAVTSMLSSMRGSHWGEWAHPFLGAAGSTLVHGSFNNDRYPGGNLGYSLFAMVDAILSQVISMEERKNIEELFLSIAASTACSAVIGYAKGVVSKKSRDHDPGRFQRFLETENVREKIELHKKNGPENAWQTLYRACCDSSLSLPNMPLVGWRFMTRLFGSSAEVAAHFFDLSKAVAAALTVGAELGGAGVRYKLEQHLHHD